MNLNGIRRQIARIQTRLADSGAGQQFRIPAHSGMFGVRTAIQQAEAAHGCAKWEPPAGEPQGAIARLRQAVLREQAWRAENASEIYRDTEAVYDIEEANK